MQTCTISTDIYITYWLCKQLYCSWFLSLWTKSWPLNHCHRKANTCRLGPQSQSRQRPFSNVFQSASMHLFQRMIDCYMIAVLVSRWSRKIRSLSPFQPQLMFVSVSHHCMIHCRSPMRSRMGNMLLPFLKKCGEIKGRHMKEANKEAIQ